MPSFLHRYQTGEHEQVWAELLALGPDIRKPRVYDDALAVARETMRRTRRNIQMIVERLVSVGYVFGPNWWEAPSPEAEFELDHGEEHPAVFAPPKPNVQAQLAELEQMAGTLPLSLYAWYEQIGSVNLVGSYPVADPQDPEGFTNWLQVSNAYPSGGWKHAEAIDASDVWANEHDLDPLQVNPIERTLNTLLEGDHKKGKTWICLAVDEHFKYQFGGSDEYGIVVPEPVADAPLLNEWHMTTFVNYLRICLRWGGFPGLECKKRAPKEELRYLTSGLDPI